MAKSAKKNKSELVPTSFKEDGGTKANKKGYVFNIPTDVADMLMDRYDFNFDQLSIGGDISLHELAIHIDEQASIEARVNLVCELSKHHLDKIKLEYNSWYERKLHNVRQEMREVDKKVSEGNIKGAMRKRHGKEMDRRNLAILDAELQHGILNKVFRQAIITKGGLLGTLRNIVQGSSGEGIGASIDFKVQKKTRKKLNVKI